MKEKDSAIFFRRQQEELQKLGDIFKQVAEQRDIRRKMGFELIPPEPTPLTNEQLQALEKCFIDNLRLPSSED